MNLTSPSAVKAWCIENGFHPNKTLGQNFLIDRNALVAITDIGLDEGLVFVSNRAENAVDAFDADVLCSVLHVIETI